MNSNEIGVVNWCLIETPIRHQFELLIVEFSLKIESNYFALNHFG